MMTQPPPTPVPDHGTGWGLLLLFIYLYGIVTLLGVGTGVAIVTHQLDRRIPTALHYLVVALLLLALGLSGFTIVVAGAAHRHDVVALLLLSVGLPLTLNVLRHRGRIRSRLALVSHAALAWSLPFLIGFGVLAVAGTQTDGINPKVTGALAVIIVVTGSMLLDRLPIFPDPEAPRE